MEFTVEIELITKTGHVYSNIVQWDGTEQDVHTGIFDRFGYEYMLDIGTKSVYAFKYNDYLQELVFNDDCGIRSYNLEIL